MEERIREQGILTQELKIQGEEAKQERFRLIGQSICGVNASPKSMAESDIRETAVVNN